LTLVITAQARDLLLTDVASVYFTETSPGVIDTFGVQRDDTLAHLVNFQGMDSASYLPVCDTAFAICETYRLEGAEFDWSTIRFWEWRARLDFDSLAGSNGRALVRIETFPKINQSSELIGVEEAHRTDVNSTTRMWMVSFGLA
jgi:hypothetical protein